MKKIIEQLEKQLENLNDLIESREDYVMDRSGHWQESEKCGNYEYKTELIEEQANELDALIDNLKEL